MSSTVLRWEGDFFPEEADLKFRLVYDGPVLATRSLGAAGEKPERAKHKFEIRRAFHDQLKNLWQGDEFLSTAEIYGDSVNTDIRAAIKGGGQRRKLHDVLAEQYEMFGWRFIPLAVEDFQLNCSLKILFLRREVPGGILQQGDIDNRVKTIFDALRLPQNKTEMFGNDEPGTGEDPFYVLLRDDSMITHAEIEADTLWESPPPEKGGQSHARVIIDVTLRPTVVSMFNLSFAGG